VYKRTRTDPPRSHDVVRPKKPYPTWGPDGLTDKQRTIYEFIRRHFMAEGQPPSYRRIMAALGIRNNNNLSQHLAKLVKKGFLRRAGGARFYGMYVPANPELVVDLADPVEVRVSATGRVTMRRDEWRKWLGDRLRELDAVYREGRTGA
jgi:hypothetical protein